MGKVNYKIKAAVIIFVVGLLARLLMYDFISAYGSFLVAGDSATYMNAAKNMLQYNVFCEEAVYPPYHGVFRTPGFPAFILAVFYFFGYSHIPVIITQIFLGALTCVLFYIIVSRYVKDRTALLVSIIFALDLPALFFTNKVMSETLFSFMLLIFIYFFLKFASEGKLLYLAAAGITAGLVTLVRPVLFYFGIFSLIIFLIYNFKDFKRLIINLAVFNICIIMVVAPWVYRNHILGSYPGIAAVQEVNLYFIKASWIEEWVSGNRSVGFDQVIEKYFKRKNEAARVLKSRGMENTPGNRVKIYRELAMETIRSHPAELVLYQVIYTADIFISKSSDVIFEDDTVILDESTKNRLHMIFNVTDTVLLGIIYLTFLIGLALYKKWPNRKELIFVLLLFLYMTALSGELGGGARFRIPLMPLMLVFSAIALEWINGLTKQIYKTII